MATTALRRARRRRLSQLLTIATAIALVGGLALVWVRVVQTLKAPAPTGQPQALGEPSGLIWDNRVFTTPGQLKAYLGPKAYRRWAVRHPTAFGAPAVSTPKTSTKTKTKTATRVAVKRHTTHATTPTKAKHTKPAKHTVAAPQVAETTSSQSILSTLLIASLLIGGLVLAASAIIPPRVAPLSVARFYADPGRRTVALATAAAIVVGVGVSSYLA